MKPWVLILDLLRPSAKVDSEMQTEVMTLINKTLVNFADMDSYYDAVDAIEEVGMDSIIKHHTNKDRNKDLIRELKAYENSVREEYDTVYIDAEDGTVKKRMQRLKSPGTPMSRCSSAGTLSILRRGSPSSDLSISTPAGSMRNLKSTSAPFTPSPLLQQKGTVSPRKKSKFL